MFAIRNCFQSHQPTLHPAPVFFSSPSFPSLLFRLSLYPSPAFSGDVLWLSHGARELTLAGLGWLPAHARNRPEFPGGIGISPFRSQWHCQLCAVCIATTGVDPCGHCFVFGAQGCWAPSPSSRAKPCLLISRPDQTDSASRGPAGAPQPQRPTTGWSVCWSGAACTLRALHAEAADHEVLLCAPARV